MSESDQPELPDLDPAPSAHQSMRRKLAALVLALGLAWTIQVAYSAWPKEQRVQLLLKGAPLPQELELRLRPDDPKKGQPRVVQWHPQQGQRVFTTAFQAPVSRWSAQIFLRYSDGRVTGHRRHMDLNGRTVTLPIHLNAKSH